MKKFTLVTLVFIGLTLTAFAQNKPKAVYQFGAVKVTVWENPKDGKYGEFTEKVFKIEKIYKKGDKWETSNNFDMAELLQLRAAIDKAISDEGVKNKELPEKDFNTSKSDSTKVK